MTNIDREIINEDLDFIQEYICIILDRHPELVIEEDDILRKIIRRMNDIDKRLNAV